MPLYEYYCSDCQGKFEVLRRISQADDPIACPYCESDRTKRAFSTFAAVNKGAGGETHSIGGSPCASCTATSCRTCGQ